MMQPAPEFPNAKINIGLKIVSQRQDGYHNIESVFYPVDLADVLEWKPAKKFSLTVYRGAAEKVPVQGNILEKAWRLLNKEYGIPPCSVHLLKNIPAGSGLGGASSDATFFLKSADSFFRLGLSIERKKEISLQLGSDCPFFTENRPAFVSGRGENLVPLPRFLEGYGFALVFTGPVSTAEAFGWLRDKKRAGLDWEKLLETPVEKWKTFVANDFEPVVFKRYPLLQEIKKILYGQGALYASLSGSGSAVYGIFDHTENFEKLKKSLPGNPLLFTGIFK